MTFSLRLVLVLAALLFVAGAKKPELTVRFYAETNARDSSSFAQPVKLQSTGREIYVGKVPVLNEHDIVGILPRTISTPVAVVGFISTHASDPAAATALLQYLASPEAEVIWKEAGYEPRR